MKSGGKNQLDHFIKSLWRVLTTNSLTGKTFGRIEIKSKSSVSQLTEFRNRSALSFEKKNLFRAKSESPNIIRLVAGVVKSGSLIVPLDSNMPANVNGGCRHSKAGEFYVARHIFWP